MTSEPLPKGVYPPPPGYTYVGKGPLNVTAIEASKDSPLYNFKELISQVCICQDTCRWVHGANGSSPVDYYAILDGSPMESLNCYGTPAPVEDF